MSFTFIPSFGIMVLTNLGIRMMLSDNAIKFLSHRPTYISMVCSTKLYEDRFRGDEAPLIAILPDGRVMRTPFMETPSFMEMKEWIEGKGIRVSITRA